MVSGPLAGRIGVVTGASRGIGREIARTLHREGASVALADVDRGGVEALAASLGERARAFEVDIAVESSVATLMDSVSATFGPPYFLVNNAALVGDVDAQKGVPILDLPIKNWRRIIDVNLTGAFICSQAAARLMSAIGAGVIINIASIQGVVATRGSTGYAVAKAGLIMLTKALAGELAEFGIRVNAVAPGPIDNRAIDGTQPTARRPDTLVGRAGTPGEVAEAVVFLLSDISTFIDGEVLMVDGGSAVRFRESPLL